MKFRRQRRLGKPGTPEFSPVPEYWNDGPIRYAEEYEDDVTSEPEIPTIDRQPLNVEYDNTLKTGFVVSGPLGAEVGDISPGGDIRGRRFDSTEQALTWARAKYPGARLHLLNQGEEPRWAIRVVP